MEVLVDLFPFVNVMFQRENSKAMDFNYFIFLCHIPLKWCPVIHDSNNWLSLTGRENIAFHVLPHNVLILKNRDGIPQVRIYKCQVYNLLLLLKAFSKFFFPNGKFSVILIIHRCNHWVKWDIQTQKIFQVYLKKLWPIHVMSFGLLSVE